jgi:hypothetical protein
MLPEEIQCMAGFGTTVKEAAVNTIQRRINAAKTTHEKTAAGVLNSMKTAVANEPEDLVRPSTLSKVAEALDVYDRFIELSDHYGDGLNFPEDDLFLFTKSAATKCANELITLQNGTTYWLHDMAKTADAFAVLGDLKDDLCDISGAISLSKVADIVPTLPRDDAENLTRALTAAGVPEANLDKTAMVRHAIGITPVDDTVQKEAAARIERIRQAVSDPRGARAALVKAARAKDVMTKLKQEAVDKQDSGSSSPTPRKGDGKYMPKAPNSTEWLKPNMTKEDE